MRVFLAFGLVFALGVILGALAIWALHELRREAQWSYLAERLRDDAGADKAAEDLRYLLEGFK